MPLLLRPGTFGHLAVAICLLALARPAFAQPAGTTWVLAVGAADEGDPAAADARDVFELLSGSLGVPASNARLLTGPAADLRGVSDALSRLSVAQPGDAVVIYFAGGAATYDLPD